MRRHLLLVIFVLAFCFAPIAEARKLALLIGVDDYENVQSLDRCVNDMKTVKKALLNIGFEEGDIQMLYTGGLFKDLPTKTKIEKSISVILSTAQPTDIVFIAFFGYGAQEGKVVYFCPPDVEMDNLSETGVSINKAMDLFANKCKARFKFMIVDACRTVRGAKVIGRRGLKAIPTPPNGIALFQSCAKGEESWEDQETRNGFFSKNFAAALSGKADANRDGKLTLFEVCTWTTAQTKEQVKERLNKSQSPYFNGSVTDFTLMEDPNVPKAFALAEEARTAMKNKDYKLAVRKFDEALDLCPNNEDWEDERQIAIDLQNIDRMHITVPDNYASIEEAYRYAEDGGIITIKPGNYRLSGTLDVNRPVTFKGSTERPEDVVIDCEFSHVFRINSGSPSFQFITVNCRAISKASFLINGGAPKLFRCDILSDKGTGIHVTGEKANPEVESCSIKKCRSNGVLVEEGCQGMFVDCDIFNNQYPEIGVGTSANPTFKNCKIHDGDLEGVIIADKGQGVFVDCDIYENKRAGIMIAKAGNPTFTHSKIHDNKNTGVYVVDGGLGSLSKCDIYSNAAAGIAIELEGNPTVDDCKIHDEKDVCVCVQNKGRGSFKRSSFYESPGAVVEVKTAGNPTFSYCSIYSGHIGVHVTNSGLGSFTECGISACTISQILVETNGNPTFTKCIIANGRGVGAASIENGLGKFNDCVIKNSETAGFLVKTSGNPTVTGCKIHDAYVGIHVMENGIGSFKDCEVYENKHTAIVVGSLANPTVAGCDIHNNPQGVNVVSKGQGKFDDCEIYKNEYEFVVSTGGNPTVTGCKIHDGKRCGVRVYDHGMGTFNNNILERNYKNNELMNWFIEFDADEVKGSGNTPPIPSRQFPPRF